MTQARKSSPASHADTPGTDDRDTAALIAALNGKLLPELLKEFLRVERTLLSLSRLGRNKALERLYRDALLRTRRQRESLQEDMERRLRDVVGKLYTEAAGRDGRQARPAKKAGRARELFMKMLANGEADLEEIVVDSPYHGELDFAEADQAAPSANPSDDSSLRAVRQLPKGSWLEFRRPDGHVYRARLAWINPVNERYIFVDEKGMQLGDKSKEGLAAEFRAGRARLVGAVAQPTADSLIDRAVGNLIGRRAGKRAQR